METLQILIVDDELGIRMGVKRVLDKFTIDYPFMDDSICFEVDEASTGEEAIEKIKEKTYDIVYLDNKLPGIQGIDVLKSINQQGPATKVIMITSYASLELAVQATKIGAQDFVPKPFTPQELRSSAENTAKQIFLKKMTRKMYKEGKQIRFQFLSLLSHELKAPLNAIEGYLNIMAEQKEGKDISAYEKHIRRSIDRIRDMRLLIFDLLDLTKIEAGELIKKIEDVNLCEVVHNAISSIKPLAIQKDINIKLNATCPIIYKTDFRDMEIIFNNLLSNAVKYNVQHGKVECTINDNEKQIEIIVSDTGIGMTTQETEKIFEEFVRIRNEQTRNISGSGLGLSIVKKTLDTYNANIDVKSTPNEGTTFTITFNK